MVSILLHAIDDKGSIVNNTQTNTTYCQWKSLNKQVVYGFVKWGKNLSLTSVQYFYFPSWERATAKR